MVIWVGVPNVQMDANFNPRDTQLVPNVLNVLTTIWYFSLFTRIVLKQTERGSFQSGDKQLCVSHCWFISKRVEEALACKLARCPLVGITLSSPFSSSFVRRRALVLQAKARSPLLEKMPSRWEMHQVKLRCWCCRQNMFRPSTLSKNKHKNSYLFQPSSCRWEQCFRKRCVDSRRLDISCRKHTEVNVCHGADPIVGG